MHSLIFTFQFWSTAIATVILQIAGFIILKESKLPLDSVMRLFLLSPTAYAPVILEGKARRHRQTLIGKGEPAPQVRAKGVIKQEYAATFLSLRNCRTDESYQLESPH